MTPTMTAAAALTPAINVVLSDSETLVVVSVDLTVSSSVLSETRFVCTGLTRVGCDVVDSDVELATVLDMVTWLLSALPVPAATVPRTLLEALAALAVVVLSAEMRLLVTMLMDMALAEVTVLRRLGVVAGAVCVRVLAALVVVAACGSVVVARSSAACTDVTFTYNSCDHYNHHAQLIISCYIWHLSWTRA